MVLLSLAQALEEEGEALSPNSGGHAGKVVVWVLVFVLSLTHCEVLGKLFLSSIVSNGKRQHACLADR